MKKIAYSLLLSSVLLSGVNDAVVNRLNTFGINNGVVYAASDNLTPPPAPAEQTKPEAAISETGAPDEMGTYSFTLSCMKAHVDELSMAGTYVEPKGTLIKTEKGNLASVKFMRSDWMKEIKVEIDGKDVEHEEEALEGAEFNVKFKLPEGKPEVKIKLYVVPMEANVAFRIVPNYDFVKISDESVSDSKVLDAKSDDSKKTEVKKDEKKDVKEDGKKEENKDKINVDNKSEDGSTNSSSNIKTFVAIGAIAVIVIAILFSRKKK